MQWKYILFFKQYYSVQTYVKPEKQITFLCHSFTMTSMVTDCLDYQLEVIGNKRTFYPAVNYSKKSVSCTFFLFCRNLFLQILEKSQKLEPAKILCTMQSLFFHRFSPHHADIITPAILFCIITDFDFILVHKITKKT